MDSTAIGCQTPPGVLEQETAYLAALRKVATFKMEGDQLRLAGPGGEAALVFRKK
jgi:heat shock protein HslJ